MIKADKAKEQEEKKKKKMLIKLFRSPVKQLVIKELEKTLIALQLTSQLISFPGSQQLKKRTPSLKMYQKPSYQRLGLFLLIDFGLMNKHMMPSFNLRRN